MATATALLEREEELATIGSSLERAERGEGALLVVEGEAGAGKTTLLDEAAELARGRGHTVMRARGGEFERDYPYGVIRQLFEPLLAARGRDELLVGTAAMAKPIFEPGDAAGGADAFALQHGLYWLLVDLAASSPLALAVDDAQWADLASLRALLYIARRIDGLAAVLTVAVRTGDPGAASAPLGELRDEPRAIPLAPRPLSTEAAEALIAVHRGAEPEPGFASACRDATAGNPLLLVELLRGLGADGSEPGRLDAERLAEVAARGMSGSILARLRRLGEEAVEAARAVAILEPSAEVHRVSRLAGLPVEAVTEACERLIEAQLLFDARPLAFVHPLVRAAVLNDLSAPRRAQAHARAAKLLDEEGAEADRVAAHLLLAEPAGEEWVVARLRAAAEAAVARGAQETAIAYLRRALREPPARDEGSPLRQALGVALLKASDPEGLGVLRAVREELADPVARAGIALDLGTSLSVRGGNEEAATMLEGSLEELADPSGPLGLQLRGCLLMQSLWGLERVPEGALPEAGERIPNDSMEGRSLLQFTGLLLAFGLGTVEEGRRSAERVLAADRVFEDALEGIAPQGLALTLALVDRGDRCDELLELGIEAGALRGVALAQHGGFASRSLCRYFDGALREAQADSDLAVPFLREAGVDAPLAVNVGTVIRILVARGELEQADSFLGRYWGRREAPPGGGGAAFLCGRAALREAQGRQAEARDDYLEAADRGAWMPQPNPELFSWQVGLARCEAALGEAQEAERLAERAVAAARRAGGARGLGIALRARGAVAGGDAAIEALRESVAALEGTRARLHHAGALVDLGAALRRANHRREARDPLREGLELAHACGAAPLERRARDELRATGARPRGEALRGVDSLTPSELRVARLAADGMTNREIAQSLFVTAKTVETHLRHVYQKLDTSRREDLPRALDGRGPA